MCFCVSRGGFGLVFFLVLDYFVIRFDFYSFPAFSFFWGQILPSNILSREWPIDLGGMSGGRGGSIGRASASISNGFHDQRFESRPEHNNISCENFSESKCCADSLSVCTHA